MAQKIIVENREWAKEENRLNYCRELEAGNILFFSDIPFPFPQDQIDFLLQQKQGKSKGRKNIAYKPELDRITNHDASDGAVAKRLHEVLRNYSKSAVEFLSLLLAPYAKEWRFSPVSREGAQASGQSQKRSLACRLIPDPADAWIADFALFHKYQPNRGEKMDHLGPIWRIGQKIWRDSGRSVSLRGGIVQGSIGKKDREMAERGWI